MHRYNQICCCDILDKLSFPFFNCHHDFAALASVCQPCLLIIHRIPRCPYYNIAPHLPTAQVESLGRVRRCRFFGVCLALWPHLDTATQSLNPHRSPSIPSILTPSRIHILIHTQNPHSGPYPCSIAFWEEGIHLNSFLVSYVYRMNDHGAIHTLFLKAIRGSTCRSMVWRIGLSFLPTLTHLPRTGICAISTVTGLMVHAVLALCHF